jgi:hypothetical protein
MTRKFVPGDRVKIADEPRARGTVLGYCRHGYALVFMGRDFDGMPGGHPNSKLAEDKLPKRYRGHVEWKKQKDLSFATKGK